MEILLTRSRLYGSSKSDEMLYRDNLTFDMIVALRWEALNYAQQARRDIEAAMKAADVEMVQFYAYFAGVNARKAFSIADVILTFTDKTTERVINWECLP